MRWFSLAALLALSACTSWRDIPNDVKFVALHSNYGPKKSSIKGEVVDVEIETGFNYIEYSQGSQDVISIFYFCDQKDINVDGLGGWSLYRYLDKWVSADSGAHDPSPPPYRYHTTIYVSWYDTFIHGHLDQTIKSYDLRENPRDLCFYTDIRTYYHEKSNIVRIPKEYLIQFFAEHPRK